MNITYTQAIQVLLKRQMILSRIYFRNSKYFISVLLIIFIPLLFTISYFFFWLDRIFYPNLEDKEIREPVFIFGHPRSGTSFLQKRISETGKVAYSTTSSLAFPSLILGKIVQPLIKLLSNIELKLLKSEAKGHKIELDGIEEDEALFLHTINTELLSILCPWMIFEEYADLGDKLDGRDDQKDRELSILFLKEYMKRQLVRQNKDRIVIKANPSIFRLKQILKYFPDAKIFYLIRSPVDTLSSFFSFHNRYHNSVLSEREQKKYFSNKYEWSKNLYNYFEKEKNEIPSDQLFTVLFPKLKNNLKQLLKEIFNFIDIEPEKGYWKKVDQVINSKRDKKYQNYNLEEFNLSIEKVKTDLDFIWKHYPGIEE